MFAFTTLTLLTLLRIVLPITLLLALGEGLRRHHPEWFALR